MLRSIFSFELLQLISRRIKNFCLHKSVEILKVRSIDFAVGRQKLKNLTNLEIQTSSSDFTDLKM